MKLYYDFISRQKLVDEKIKSFQYGGREPYGVFKFTGSDSKSKWEERILTENSPSVHFFQEHPIEYRYNNYGFRTYDDFNRFDKGIITLGCSFTEGVGMHLEDTWSYKLSNYFNKKLFNLGIGGRGVKKNFETLSYFFEYLNFDDVFFLVPPHFRFNYYLKDNDLIQDYLVNSDEENIFLTPFGEGNPFKDENYLDFLKALHFGGNYDTFIYNLAYMYAIKGLCLEGQKNLHIIFSTGINWLNGKDKITDNEAPNLTARDIHPGFKENYFIYKSFLEIYNTH